jgi:hypothetical protein
MPSVHCRLCCTGQDLHLPKGRGVREKRPRRMPFEGSKEIVCTLTLDSGVGNLCHDDVGLKGTRGGQ